MTEVTAAPTTSASLAPHQIWIRTRGLLLALLVLGAAGIALATMRSGDQHGRLDPVPPTATAAGPSPNSSRSVASPFT